MYNEFEEETYDNALDALLDFMKFLPKDTVKMINFDRYRTMMQTAAELKDILAETVAQGQLDIEISDVFNMGSITVELDALTVENVPQFAAMIAKADHFEIYPRTDGKIQLDITFQSVLKTIGYSREK